MKPYAKERCTNPGAFYASAQEVLADAGLTNTEKEYILKSMAVKVDILGECGGTIAASGERPAEVTEIDKALDQLGETRTIETESTVPASEAGRIRSPFMRIIAAINGHDDLDGEVVNVTGSLVRLSGGEAAFVSVIPPDPGPPHFGVAAPMSGATVTPPKAQTDLKTRLDERRARVREILSDTDCTPSSYHLEIRHGWFQHEVLRAAEEHSAQLIVIGSHDRSWIEGLVTSATAQQVASLATRPVLIVPETVKD